MHVQGHMPAQSCVYMTLTYTIHKREEIKGAEKGKEALEEQDDGPSQTFKAEQQAH